MMHTQRSQFESQSDGKRKQLFEAARTRAHQGLRKPMVDLAHTHIAPPRDPSLPNAHRPGNTGGTYNSSRPGDTRGSTDANTGGGAALLERVAHQVAKVPAPRAMKRSETSRPDPWPRSGKRTETSRPMKWPTSAARA